MRNLIYKQKGFTLVEILIVTSIIGILLTTGLASYNNFNRKRMVREAALELMNNLRYAQEKALSGEKPTGCGVLNGWQLKFNGADYDYKIQAICGGSPFGEEKKFSFPQEVSRESGADFLFKVLAQGVDYIGSGDIILTGFGAWRYQITVTHSGEISDEGFQ